MKKIIIISAAIAAVGLTFYFQNREAYIAPEVIINDVVAVDGTSLIEQKRQKANTWFKNSVAEQRQKEIVDEAQKVFDRETAKLFKMQKITTATVYGIISLTSYATSTNTH